MTPYNVRPDDDYVLQWRLLQFCIRSQAEVDTRIVRAQIAAVGAYVTPEWWPALAVQDDNCAISIPSCVHSLQQCLEPVVPGTDLVKQQPHGAIGLSSVLCEKG